ncbi:hypothetical protein TCAL_00364 [Tigriopus californicus]|uniref:Large ribosomal subunit protein uL14m n=1 Tax=Tigriopus californicus TaxID=6832 RepID=A0A553NEA1_TIGCA|nr:large ribosomal subunit protein uL14m-like [Tigriopus californicus]TRY63774.1 hypothetical protein TCAL_00364 [Tigriopus californicus]|eukprot:TCALIF_00364-PA protein Name:"Similar to mrpl14 39S ribosomal protein L14, mitochondrial (Danio rerio)" AED:0.09 eAED:0.10 QI:0/-1/0/1/-1/1/1/0/184
MISLLTRLELAVPPLSRGRSLWRYNDVSREAAWPNCKPSVTHHRHQFRVDTYGIQRTTRLRVVDNSEIGREAMALGRPPKVIGVNSGYHRKKPHGAIGGVGDRVTMAILGQVKRGIIVGTKISQKPGHPRFDSNNVVLIGADGTPLGTRIHAPLSNAMRPVLKAKSHPKKVDYTKILALATRFV